MTVPAATAAAVETLSNIGVAAPVAWFPFSGWKASFNGDLHANGQDAIEFYTRKKVVTERWT